MALNINSYPQNIKFLDLDTNFECHIMLDGGWIPENTHDINFDGLLPVKSDHIVINDVRYAWGRKVNQHGYIIYYENRFWSMWSEGPGLPRPGISPKEHRDVIPGHDQPGQLISYSTSIDGANWTEPLDLAGSPEDGFGWIARGFWIYNNKLFALAARYRAPSYKGDGLQLHLFEMEFTGRNRWIHKGLLFDNAMNNFPPKELPNGEWMMSRRDSLGNISILIGAEREIHDWESIFIMEYNNNELAPEEPLWFLLPDNSITAIYRDNKRGGYLYRAFSLDNGRTWSRPVKTNFPDATSKFHGIRLKSGQYILVSNPNPIKRDPLTIAISDDGIIFNKLGYLVGGHTVDYPFVMEHEGYLYITYSSAKQTIELLRIKLEELDSINMINIK